MKTAFRMVLPIAVPVIILNVFFLWTSQVLVLLDGSPSHTELPGLVNRLINLIMFRVSSFSYYSKALHLDLSGLIVVDLISVSCLASIFLLLWRRESLLRAIQVSALITMVLPVEVYLGDPGQFNIFATTAQETYQIAPWFTNAYLLWSCLAVLSFATVLTLLLGRPKPLENNRRGE